jgi:glyoxylase-like metal-dependent hydrolase (beta-lactamase superfamily II)
LNKAPDRTGLAYAAEKPAVQESFMVETDLLAISEAILDGRTSIDVRHPLNIGTDAVLQEVADGVAFVEAFANVTAIDTSAGLVLVDASGPLHAQAVHDSIRSWTAKALHSAVFTHGHIDHIYAVARFEAEGGAPARVIAHEAIVDRFRRYEATNGYNAIINQRQFQLGQPIFPGGYRYPDETYRDRLEVTVGDVQLDLRHDRGETDDGTWVWLADRGIICAGDLFIWASPNCGNPQKVQRYPAEWAVALRAMADLGAELLLPGHGLPIAGRERINTVLTETAELLESLVDQTLQMMNQGARLDEIVHSVAPPAHLLERPWLQPVYDEPEFVVHNLWRLYGGWYDGDPSHLKPAPAAALAAELAQLVGGAGVLADRARALSESGEHRLAGHLAELAAQAAPNDVGVSSARAEVFGRRAALERSTMAKGVFRWAAAESERIATDPTA